MSNIFVFYSSNLHEYSKNTHNRHKNPGDSVINTKSGKAGSLKWDNKTITNQRETRWGDIVIENFTNQNPCASVYQLMAELPETEKLLVEFQFLIRVT